MFDYVCCQTFGKFLVVPCFWPHLLIIWPCLSNTAVAQCNSIQSQYWILTERELKVVSLSHDTCCVPGCWRTGDTVKTIPLENITDCGIREPGTGCVGKCAGSLPIMYVDTASDLGSLPDQHEATAIGLADYQWFMEEILNRRDAIKGFVRSNYPQRHQQGVVGHDGTEAMDRGGPSSAAERIRTVTELHQSGVITEAQFEKKKQEIIDSI